MLSDAPVAANIAVSDLNRAKDFYGNKLGLTSAPGPTENEVLFACGNHTTLQVYQKPNPTPSENTVATWRVDNLDNAMETLRGTGIEFEDYDIPDGPSTQGGVATVGALKAAWFKDPDGNILCVHEDGS